MSRIRRLRGDERERGAVLIIAALSLIGLIVVAAIVVDLGMARETRREAQSDADLAALAGGWFLAGNGSTAYAKNPRAGCEAVLESLQENINDWPSTAGLPCTGFPQSTGLCTTSSPATTVTSTSSSPYGVTVSWPVPDTEIDRDEFGGTGVFDGSPCERMSVEIRRKDPAFFAGVIGRNGETIRARAVVRVDPREGAKGVPALLFLERRTCQVLDVSSGGGNASGIHVFASGPQMGYIHSDSRAQVGDGCTTNENAGGYNVYGTALPSGGPSIRADGVPASGTSSAVPGRIGLYSLYPGVNGRGGAVYQGGCSWLTESNNAGCAASGLSSEAVGADIMSRRRVDDRYGARITTLYSDARSSVLTDGAGADRIVTGSACGNGGDGATYPEARVYVRCSTFSAQDVTFLGSKVTFSGQVSVAGPVRFPNVRELYIAGCGASGGSNCTGLEIKPGGVWAVNTSWPSSVACTAERPSGDPTVNWSVMAVLGGPFTVQNATVRMCQTAVFLSYESGSSFQPVRVTSGAPNCSTIIPCPADTVPSGVQGASPRLDLSNAQSVNWTAPNQSSDAPTDASPYEDLALWTEAISGGSSELCGMSGQATTVVAGIFFHPNCRFQYAGQADNSNQFNAQFIGRSMVVSGQGVLRLQPNPQDSILVPLSGTPRLIR